MNAMSLELGTSREICRYDLLIHVSSWSKMFGAGVPWSSGRREGNKLSPQVLLHAAEIHAEEGASEQSTYCAHMSAPFVVLLEE